MQLPRRGSHSKSPRKSRSLTNRSVSSGSTAVSASSINDRSQRGSVKSAPGLESQKMLSLAEFDPFSPDAPLATPPLTLKKVTAPVPESPLALSPDERNDGSPDSIRLEQLQNELRAIAVQLEQESPRKSSPVAPPSPERKIRKSSPKAKIFAPFGKKMGHRRSESLDANKRLWKEEQKREATLSKPSTVQKRSATISATTSRKSLTNCTTPPRDAVILQEVWMKQDAFQASVHMSPTTVTTNPGIESLYIPSLAKPRPTSFLTPGKEILRTSEYDATEWQLGIPKKKEFQTCTKVLLFLDTYRSEECLLDLRRLVGYSRLELTQFATGSKMSPVKDISDCHRPIVEALLDCCDDLVGVRGYWHNGARNIDQRREVLILERQHEFLVVVRGADSEQQQGRSQRQCETVSLKDKNNATVFADGLRAIRELEDAVFACLDQLTEATPFCDIVFSGHAFGASMATIAAYLYAYTRGDQRVGAIVSGSPKVGLTDFRWAVHASPNLKVMRLEYGNSSPRVGPTTQDARHVGHTIRLCKQQGVKAYKFSTGPVESRGGPRSRLFKKERDISDYVEALEDLSGWVSDYYKEDGVGVRGKDNEARQMV